MYFILRGREIYIFSSNAPVDGAFANKMPSPKKYGDTRDIHNVHNMKRISLVYVFLVDLSVGIPKPLYRPVLVLYFQKGLHKPPAVVTADKFLSISLPTLTPTLPLPVVTAAAAAVGHRAINI